MGLNITFQKCQPCRGLWKLLWWILTKLTRNVENVIGENFLFWRLIPKDPFKILLQAILRGYKWSFSFGAPNISYCTITGAKIHDVYFLCACYQVAIVFVCWFQVINTTWADKFVLILWNILKLWLFLKKSQTQTYRASGIFIVLTNFDRILSNLV